MRLSLCTIAHYAVDCSRRRRSEREAFDAQERATRAQGRLRSLAGATIIATTTGRRKGCHVRIWTRAVLSLSPPSCWRARCTPSPAAARRTWCWRCPMSRSPSRPAIWRKIGPVRRARTVPQKSVVISGIGSANAVISGSADFAQISGATLTRAAARGQRLLGIVGTLNWPVIQIVLRKEIAAAGFDPKAPLERRAQVLRSPHHRGRFPSTPSSTPMCCCWRGAPAIAPTMITPMAPNSAIAAFQTRQVDGFAMSMPWPLQAVLARQRRRDRQRLRRRPARYVSVRP